jgi:hypothetical protein
VANTYDSSGTFQARGRAGSVKRKRSNEEIDVVFDLSEAYPPLTPPQRPKIDIVKVQGLMVAATSAAGVLRPMIVEESEIDPKTLAVAKLSLALCDAFEALVECGIMPLSSNTVSRSSGGGGTGGERMAPVPPPKPVAPAGLKELREGLEKADRESILFDADLGKVTLANRKSLAAAFSAGIRAAAVSNARAANEDPAEAVRVMDDALSVVQDMDFIGASSKPFHGKTETDLRNGTFCTMPIKFKFEDRDSRIHFETSMRKLCTLRASMSLPFAIRKEQAAFQKAIRERYPEEVTTVRVDTLSMSLQAYKKADGEKKWTKCPEKVALPPGILLQGYSPREHFVLPPLINVEAGAAQSEAPMESY